MIYLDNAATTFQKPAAVQRAVMQAMRTMSSPGRGGYGAAQQAEETLFRCRSAAAALFSVPSVEQVVFTMNATHGLNISIKSLVRPCGRVVVSGYEHNAVMSPMSSALFLPIERIAQLCRRADVPLIIDASQSAGSLPIDFSALAPAFVAMPGHKGLYGPQGTGLLLCGSDALLLVRAARAANRCVRACRTFCPTGWRPARTMFLALPDLKPGSPLCARSGRSVSCITAARSSVEQERASAKFQMYTDFSRWRQACRQGVLSFTVDGLSPLRFHRKFIALPLQFGVFHIRISNNYCLRGACLWNLSCPSWKARGAMCSRSGSRTILISH